MEARYVERIHACTTQDELAEYLSCVPIIREYTSETEKTETTTHVANLKVATKKEFNEMIYIKNTSEMWRGKLRASR
jgi:hypothetical protein